MVANMKNLKCICLNIWSTVFLCASDRSVIQS